MVSSLFLMTAATRFGAYPTKVSEGCNHQFSSAGCRLLPRFCPLRAEPFVTSQCQLRPIPLLQIRSLFLALLMTVLTGLARSELHPSSSSAEVPRQSENLVFSHRFHLTQTKASCQDCHATIQASTAASDTNLPVEKDCLKCHDGQQARRECTVCHERQGGAVPL